MRWARARDQRAEIDWRWINGSQPFRVSGNAQPKPSLLTTKCVKGQEHSTVEMRSKSDLRSQLILQAIHARVKTMISNHEREVEVMKINSHDKKGNKYTAMVYFVEWTSMDERQGFSLQKIMGPTKIYGWMKVRSRSTVENMSQCKTSRSVQKREVGSGKNGMWMEEVKDASDQMAEKALKV